MQRIQYSFRDDDTDTASRIDAADGPGMCLCSGYLAITIQFSWIAGNSFSKFAICFLKGAKVSAETAVLQNFGLGQNSQQQSNQPRSLPHKS